MKPPVRYAKTVDGGNVAFTVAGDGDPLVDIFAGPECNHPQRICGRRRSVASPGEEWPGLMSQ
jgi:hypothetical protein